MAQGLTRALYTYYVFIDMTFSFLPSTQSTAVILSIIRDNRNTAFSPFIDNYNRAAIDFNSMAKLLYEEYFLRVV